MSEIITVCGPIKSEELGITSMHEHTISDPMGIGSIMLRSMPYMMKGVFGYEGGADVQTETKRREELGISIPQMSVGGVLSSMKVPKSNPASKLSVMEYYVNELKAFKDLGGDAVCDCSPVPNHFVNTGKVVELAKRSGVHIIGAAGYYIHPAIPKRDVKEGISFMTDKIRRLMVDGDPAGGWRPGFGKCAIGTLIDGEIACSERMAVKATALAAKEEGFCLHIHTAFPVRQSQVIGIADMLTKEVKIDPERVIFCHMDSYNIGTGNPSVIIKKEGYGMDLSLELLKRGYNIGLDTWSISSKKPEEIAFAIEARKSMLLELIGAGYASRITLGHDMMSRGSGMQNGGSGYLLWPRTLMEMRDSGRIDEQVFRLLTIENPRRILSVDR